MEPYDDSPDRPTRSRWREIVRFALLAAAWLLASVTTLVAQAADEDAVESLFARLDSLLVAGDRDRAGRVALEIGETSETETRIRNLVRVADLYQAQTDSVSLHVANAHLDSALALHATDDSAPDEDEARALQVKGIVAYRRALYAEAIDFGDASLAVCERLATLPVATYGRTMNLLAAAHLATGGRGDQAKALFLKAIATLDNDDDAPLVQAGFYRHNLAELYVREARYDTAQILISEALENFEKTRPGPDLISRSYTLRGDVRRLQGDYRSARDDYHRGHQMKLESLRPDHPELRYTYNSLGNLHTYIGEYPEAVENYRACIRIMDRELSAADPERAVFRTNLGRCYIDMGRPRAAAALLDSALAIHRLGEGQGWQPATTMLELAVAKGRLGEIDTAEHLLLEAIEIFSSHLDPSHPRLGEAWTELGALYRRSGHDREAERALVRALRVFRDGLGEDDITRVDPLIELGELYLSQKRWLRASVPLVAAQRIVARKDPPHEVSMRLHEALAYLRYIQGDDRRALELALDAAESHRKLREDSILALSMDQALRYADREVSGLGLACRLMLESDRSWDVERVWDELILNRGLVQTEMRTRRLLSQVEEDPDLADAACALREATRDLASLTVRGYRSEIESDVESGRRQARLGQTTHTRHLEEARRRQIVAERRLAERSLRMQAIAGTKSVDLKDIEASLPRSSVLVSYLRIDLALDAVEDARPVYFALVLSRSGHDPEAVPLGNADKIDAMIESWRTSLRSASEGESATRGDDGPRARAALVAGRALRRAVLDPLRTRIGEADLVYVVPDAQLALVNLAALPEDDGRYVIEGEVLIQPLSSERDLVALDTDAPAALGVLVVGSPDFGDAGRAESGEGPFAELAFAPLEAASMELDNIVEIVGGHEPVTELVGPEATEQAVVDLMPGQRIIHLATHGFFLEPGFEEDSATRRNPLLLSGLALAGANDRTDVDGFEGVLTAEEINLLDLEGCRWVVLSACRSGLGALHHGEGVIGLRRAFQLAGARTVIMSLRNVGDAAAAAWMSRLYRARYEDGLSTAAAVKASGLRGLEECKARGLRTLPCDWGAFVAVGDWR